MEFVLLFTDRKGAAPPEPAGMAEMTELAGELASRGILKRGAPLAPASAATRVRVRAGKPFVSDGPFAESKEVVGGFWIVDVADRDAAIEIARRSPHARHATVEVHPVEARYCFGDPEVGTPFLLAFWMEPGLTDPDGAKMLEMTAFGDELVQAGKLFETAPLASHPPPARIETRGGKALVTDGPFAEVQEVVGGYALVRAAGQAEAIELAKGYPHARWGAVEVREILFFDPV